MDILSVKVKTVVDENPDLSLYLGVYGSSPDSEWAVDREERGDKSRGEYRFWNPARNVPPGSGADWEHVEDNLIALALAAHGNRAAAIRALGLQQIEDDYQRHEAYCREDWHMIGVYAEAKIKTPSGTLQTIRSAGLFGIESDSDGEYIARVGWEELLSLSEELRSFGLSQAAIEGALTEAQCEV